MTNIKLAATAQAAKSSPLDHSNSRIAGDRAGVITTAILQIVREALLAWLYRSDADMAAARAEIETLLRDEFHDIARETLGEIRLEE